MIPISSGTSSTSRSPTSRRSRCSATRGGRPPARPRRCPAGRPGDHAPGFGFAAVQCRMRAGQRELSHRRTPNWTAADGALLDELVHLLGPMPAEEADPSMFLDPDAEFSEVITTADRLSTPREVDPFELPHETYAHVLVVQPARLFAGHRAKRPSTTSRRPRASARPGRRPSSPRRARPRAPRRAPAPPPRGRPAASA